MGRSSLWRAPAYQVPLGPRLSLRSTVLGFTQSTSIDPTTLLPPTNLVPRLSSVLSWPADALNYRLQFSDSFHPVTRWAFLATGSRSGKPCQGRTVVLNGQNVVTNLATTPMRFYQLRPIAP